MRGITALKTDEEKYQSYGGFYFETKEKAEKYNRRIAYKFEEESNRILKEMRKND